MKKYFFVVLMSMAGLMEATLLNAIVLLENGQPLLDLPNDEKRYGVYFYDDFSIKHTEMEKLLTPFLGKTLDRALIEEIQNQVMQSFQKEGYPFLVVRVPPQEISDGILQLECIEGKVGAIRVEGNKRTRTKLLKRYLRVQPGDKIKENVVAKDLDFMNRNPFRSVSLIYSPGLDEGTTDITLVSQDRKPLQFYLGSQNNGVTSTGRQRWFTGLTKNYCFGLDHILTVQYTTSSDFNEFQAYTAQYMALLSWRHVLNIYGGFSKVHLQSGSSFHNKGINGQASFRYMIPLPINRHLLQELIFGFDYKRLNNTVSFSEGPAVIGKNVNLTQLQIGYQGSYNLDDYAIDFHAELFYSPGQWLPDQSSSDFTTLQPGATNHWVYGRASLSYLQALPHDFSLYLNLQGEASSTTLLATEEMGLGGYDTVRGYDERELNRDNAYLANFEIRSPPFHLLSSKVKNRKDSLQLLAFLDYGGGVYYKNPFPNENNFNFLLGVGPGLRYRMDPGMDVRVDWGIRLHTAEDVGGGGSLLHFSAIVNF